MIIQRKPFYAIDMGADRLGIRFWCGFGLRPTGGYRCGIHVALYVKPSLWSLTPVHERFSTWSLTPKGEAAVAEAKQQAGVA